MQAITGRHFQIVQLLRQMHVFKFSGRSRSNIRGELSALALGVELLRSFVSKGLDHAAYATVSRDACQHGDVWIGGSGLLRCLPASVVSRWSSCE